MKDSYVYLFIDVEPKDVQLLKVEGELPEDWERNEDGTLTGPPGITHVNYTEGPDGIYTPKDLDNCGYRVHRSDRYEILGLACTNKEIIGDKLPLREVTCDQCVGCKYRSSQ